jgi:hypothetical protein
MRYAAYHEPRIAPCFETASIAYWEHVGENRQQGPVSAKIIGDMNF